jgi:hypothetical protein
MLREIDMTYKPEVNNASRKTATAMSGVLVIFALCLPPAAFAQNPDRARDGDRVRDTDRIARLEAGTVIPVRANDAIEVEKGDNRVYTGIVDQDVQGNNGRLVIPRGSRIELIVRISQNNDLILDLESVAVNGQRYGIRTEPKRIESRRDDSLIGGIVGAISGGEARGRAVRIPREALVTFRLQRALDMGVADRGVMRDGSHYHDYYDQQDRNR